MEDVYNFDKNIVSTKIYGTSDLKHPGVAKTMSMKEFLVGGKIDYVKRPNETPIRRYRKTPFETRDFFQKAGWKTIVAFQTRNVPHVAHEMLQKASLNTHDGLFVNPLVGKKKSGDYKDEAIVATYETLIEHYYPLNRCYLGTLTYRDEICRTQRGNTSCYNAKKLWMHSYHNRTRSCRCRYIL